MSEEEDSNIFLEYLSYYHEGISKKINSQTNKKYFFGSVLKDIDSTIESHLGEE
jgi:hypothetical protein